MSKTNSVYPEKEYLPNKYWVKKVICISCGQCALDCPTKAINPGDDKKYEINQPRCIVCGHCGALCPVNAIKYDKYALPKWENPKIEPEKLLSFIIGKRSMRRYEGREIPHEILQDILYAGSMTATAVNSQGWEAHIYTGEELKNLIKVASASMFQKLKRVNTPWGRQLAKLAGFKKYAAKSFLKRAIAGYGKGIDGSKDPFFFNAPCVVLVTSPKKKKDLARTDAVMAATHMMLYAQSHKIGSCFIGFLEIAIGKNKRARREVGITDDRNIAATFTLGYSAQEYRRLPIRKDIGSIPQRNS